MKAERHLLWDICAAVVFLAVVFLISVAFGVISLKALEAKKIRVIDGDTIKVAGTTHRLMNYNSPEIWHPKCDKELQYGLKARDLLQEKIDGAKKIRLVRSKQLDIYGRMLSTLYLDGVSTDKILIEAELANHYKSPYSKKRNWCK